MTSQRIFYFVYDDQRPRGGEKHSYQHVDILNSHGFEAYALHTQRGFRLRWFENETRVVDLEGFWDLYDKARDVIVLPEPLGALTFSVPGRRVIFNKNLYLGYASLGLSRQPRYPFDHDEVVGVFTVSEHNERHLRFAFPNAPVFRMYPCIDTAVFAFTPLLRKKRQIACATKAAEDVAVLYHTLWARSAAGLNQLGDYEWVFLQGLSEREMARVLGESLIFISLSTHEGLPRMVLEAMAAGCHVLAYGTGPLRECLPPEYQCEHDDFVGMVRRVEELAAIYPTRLDRWTGLAEQGRGIAEAYTRERQEQHLLAAWREILSRSR